MMKSRLLFPLFTAILLSYSFLFYGCSGDVNDPQVGEASYLFEVAHVNWAWGYQHGGRYVDGEGNVWSYQWPNDKQHAWKGYADPNAITTDELQEKYAPNRTFVATLDPEELAAMKGKIQAAAQGEFTEHVQVGNDAGGGGKVAFLYNPATNTYRQIELEVSGDVAYHNTSPEAVELAEWLKELPR